MINRRLPFPEAPLSPPIVRLALPASVRSPALQVLDLQWSETASSCSLTRFHTSPSTICFRCRAPPRSRRSAPVLQARQRRWPRAAWRCYDCGFHFSHRFFISSLVQSQERAIFSPQTAQRPSATRPAEPLRITYPGAKDATLDMPACRQVKHQALFR